MLSTVSCACCDILRSSEKTKANAKCHAFLKVSCQCALRLRKRRFKRVRAVRQYHYKTAKEVRSAHGDAEVYFHNCLQCVMS